jgi:hypothetical protein
MRNIRTFVLVLVANVCISLAFAHYTSASAEPTGVGGNDFYQAYSYREEVRNGMHYGIWYKDHWTSQTGYSLHVVNLTKDELEVQLIRKQLAEKR